MRIVLISLLLILLPITYLHAEHYQPSVIDLKDIERKVRKGSKADLIKLCDYVKDTQMVIDHLGYHEIPTTNGAIAGRLLLENTFVLDQNRPINDSITISKVREKILANAGSIYFDTAIGAFILSPIKYRSITYQVRRISNDEQIKLRARRNRILYANWLKRTNIVKLINDHNPIAMAAVAELMLKNRDRYDENRFDEERYTDLIALLTGYEVGVHDNSGKITFRMNRHFEDAFGTIKLNYATYWLAHYQNYKWNTATNKFENKVDSVISVPREYTWYQKLNDRSDDTAIEAFKRLTECDCEAITDMNNEFGIFNHSWVLPTFYDRFLIQMCELTRYSRAEHIYYKGNPQLNKTLSTLGERDLSFARRYAIEDKLINTLTLDEITAVEYWGLVYENRYATTWSIGRILDKFYSENWREITSDPRHLSLYLKKANLYDRLGIIGSCNFYLAKFTNADSSTVVTLKAIDKRTEDDDIKNSINQVLTGSFWNKIESKKKADSIRISGYRSKEKKTWPDNLEIAPVIGNIEDSLRKIYSSKMAKSRMHDELRDACFLATYHQLPIAIKYLLKIRGDSYYDIDNILQGLFGIPIDYIRSDSDIKTFLLNYHKMNELSLYRYYLHQSGFEIEKEHGELDYDKIYAILKYDYVLAFVGGGNMERKTGIFAVTKVLERQFGLNFELPEKNEHRISSTVYSFTNERRKKWLNYLIEHKFVKTDNEPPSFWDSRVY